MYWSWLNRVHKRTEICSNFFKGVDLESQRKTKGVEEENRCERERERRVRGMNSSKQ
jgi:hypothetical protein